LDLKFKTNGSSGGARLENTWGREDFPPMRLFRVCAARAPLEELKAAAGKSLVSQLQEHRTREYDSRRARIKKGLIILLFR
jgi:hypothetical protein